MTEQRTPHPALSLPGFTRPVTLSTGLEVHIRKVDVEAVTLDAARHAAGALGEGEAAPRVEEQVALTIDVRRRLLKASLIQPTLPELMTVYGGTDEDADLGLGTDLTVLLEAVDEFNRKPEKAVLPDKAAKKK